MAHIIRMTTVVRDGMHNAFTDLQYWQGNYWVAYRKGAGHVSMDGSPVIAVSSDRQRFREVAQFHVRGDCRDPKLLPIDDGRMAAYFPSWTHGAAARDLQHYITFTDNGFDWEKPQPILDQRLWLWRVRRHGGRYYGLVQNLTGDWSDGNKPHNLDLAVSDDLTGWETIARVGDGLGMNESDIYWQPDGEAWIVSRTVHQDEETASYFASARPPYTVWETTPMKPMVHAPVFVEHNDSLYVAGRCSPDRDGWDTFPFHGASTCVWRVGRGKLEPILHVPAGGDCSYPGLMKDPEGRICMSYYSQHAYQMGIARPPVDVSSDEPCRAADVYFAELELD